MAPCRAFAAVVVLAAFASLAIGASTPPNGGMPYGGGGTSVVPWAPNNLAPFQALWNSNLCFFYNQSTACPPNYLNQTGKIYVSKGQVQQFCSPGCLNVLFNDTLTCIYKVTKYNSSLTFKFTSGATVWQLNNTVQAACANITAGVVGNFTVPIVKK